ncbi:helix-turn-helix domain-containing protein [Abyssibius alkaniclasticus]|uniref:helix-turn-helix domain-containing protein n=1 Tax=Abyssibius alkaniclasticus TaxID=2881234 RepID=UPI0023633602|nr:helix-turn-helix transcriptional regulator [Abyssibius alkaniclasticus]UPH71515.1 helix-turn-helix domain-containing protein [Abyssibius alkaniclasticus]|tara:strand:+ start:613 stop:978 length:366 start_codon:yes stop_codon:yes gene_type:complete
MIDRITHIDELFGQLIVIKRKKLNLDQRQLAAKLGINQPGLSRIERGESSVNITMLKKLATALDTTTAKIMDDFDIETCRLEKEEGISVRPKSDLPKNSATLGKVMLGGAALALILSRLNK